MRINHVKKARKDQGRCRRCGAELQKGSGYKWIKRRYGPKICICPDCQFKRSDMTSSDKLARVYDAQNSAESTVNTADDPDDLRSALEELADEIREVAEEYQESADNIREHFSESETADDCEEKAQDLESWADECDPDQLPEWDDWKEDNPEGCRADFIDELRSIAAQAVDACPL